MNNSVLIVAAMLMLAVGTFASRLAGPVLRTRMSVPPETVRLLETASIVLLAALGATSALADGRSFAGFARPAAVVCAGLLAWRRVPFLVVVLTAAAVAAGLRALGVP